jgi:murein DD-endopeptidase MepM/ murein hydrolase activator NlpD
MYVNAGSSPSQSAVDPEGVARLETRSAYLGVVVDTNDNAVNELIFLQEDRKSLEEQFQTLAAEQEELAAEAAVIAERLTTQLEQYNEEYQEIYGQWQKEEAARRAAREAARIAAAAAASGFASSAFVDPTGRTCPVAGANTFRDSWLEPRPYRGGYHHGTDLIAATGTPLVAMESGYIYSRGYHWAGGNGLYIRGNSGDIYYYAHMQGYAAGTAPGSRVGVTQIVGWVGSTGASSVPHLHLGFQPGGGALTNPYQLLVKLCR